jgi:hypothetical protein
MQRNNLLHLSSHGSVYELGGVPESGVEPLLYFNTSPGCLMSLVDGHSKKDYFRSNVWFSQTWQHTSTSQNVLSCIHDGSFQVCEATFNTLPDRRLSKYDRQSGWAFTFPGHARLVRDYTKRRLSYPSDALNAFSGLLEIFKHRFERNSSGSSINHFDAALLWVPAGGRQQLTRNHLFPSYTWAGWIGPVEYWQSPDSLSPECFNNRHNAWYTTNTTNLKSAITCFHFLGQPLGQDIDGNLSNTGRSNSDHGGILNLQKCQLEERDTRSILEFDAFAINITGFPVDQVHIYNDTTLGKVELWVQLTVFWKNLSIIWLTSCCYPDSRPYPRMRNPVA